MMRTSSVRALSGWVGIPYDDEVALFAALSEITDGYYDEALTWLYRHHSLQVHRTDAARFRSADCRRVALQRAIAVRNCGLQLDTATPHDLSEIATDINVGPAVKDKVIQRTDV
jgi:hypothetical protein